ncbi:hypothetical protein BHF98_11675 [Corynebacterium diphtheriae]|nr:hypothetical protein BHF98_11675 [Corynebacterium diphtheriae]
MQRHLNINESAFVNLYIFYIHQVQQDYQKQLSTLLVEHYYNMSKNINYIVTFTLKMCCSGIPTQLG